MDDVCIYAEKNYTFKAHLGNCLQQGQPEYMDVSPDQNSFSLLHSFLTWYEKIIGDPLHQRH